MMQNMSFWCKFVKTGEFKGAPAAGYASARRFDWGEANRTGKSRKKILQKPLRRENRLLECGEENRLDSLCLGDCGILGRSDSLGLAHAVGRRRYCVG